MPHARIKPFSTRHGRTTRRYTIGGRLFEEGFSSPKGQSRWYIVSDALGDILKTQRNEVDKRIFDVVTEAQARAIDIQEGSPHASHYATEVRDVEVRARVFEQAERRARDPLQDVIWRYDPDAEHVPELPEGFLDSILPATAARVAPATVPKTAPRTRASTAKKDDAGAWDEFEQEQRVQTAALAARAQQELEDLIDEDAENSEGEGETRQPAASTPETAAAVQAAVAAPQGGVAAPVSRRAARRSDQI